MVIPKFSLEANSDLQGLQGRDREDIFVKGG